MLRNWQTYLCSESGLIFKFALNIGSSFYLIYLCTSFKCCISSVNACTSGRRRNVEVVSFEGEFYPQIHIFDLGSHECVVCEKLTMFLKWPGSAGDDSVSWCFARV